MTTQETTTLYKFEELSQEAKERAIEKYREHCLDYDGWEFELEDFHEQLKEVGLSCNDFYFDIYRGSFYLSKPCIENPDLLMKSAGLSKWLIVNELAGKEQIYYASCISDSNERNNIYFDDLNKIDENFIISKEEGEEFDSMEETLNDFLSNLCQKFLKQLRAQESYLSSDEAITETLIANDYDFEVDGRRW